MISKQQNTNKIVFSNVALVCIICSNLVGSTMFTNPVQLLNLFKSDLEISRVIEASRFSYELGPISE